MEKNLPHEQFKEFLLLFEDLVRKETVAYAQANPKDHSGENYFRENYGMPRAFDTLRMIYGREIIVDFKNEYERKKKHIAGE